MAIYNTNNVFVCEKCGHDVFFEKELITITSKDINSSLSKTVQLKKDILKTELICNKCGHIMSNPIF